jgi:hypothetical protein
LEVVVIGREAYKSWRLPSNHTEQRESTGDVLKGSCGAKTALKATKECMM